MLSESLLEPSEMRELIAIFTRSNLTEPERRPLLLDGLADRIRLNLPSHQRPLDQLRSDAQYLQDVSVVDITSPPLVTWMRNAMELVSSCHDAQRLADLVETVNSRLSALTVAGEVRVCSAAMGMSATTMDSTYQEPVERGDSPKRAVNAPARGWFYLAGLVGVFVCMGTLLVEGGHSATTPSFAESGASSETLSVSTSNLSDARKALTTLYGQYGVSARYPAAARYVARHASEVAKMFLDVPVAGLSHGERVLRHHGAAFSYTIAASMEPHPHVPISSKERLQSASLAVEYIRNALGEVSSARQYSRTRPAPALEAWLNEGLFEPRLRYCEAVALSVLVYLDAGISREEVERAVARIPYYYQRDYPPNEDYFVCQARGGVSCGEASQASPP